MSSFAGIKKEEIKPKHKRLLEAYLNGQLQGIQHSFKTLSLELPVPNTCYIYTHKDNDLIIIIFCFKIPGKIELRVADFRYCFTEWAVYSPEAAALCRELGELGGYAEQLGIIAVGTSYKVDEPLGTFDVDILLNNCQEPFDKAYLLNNLKCLQAVKKELIAEMQVVKGTLTKPPKATQAGAQEGVQ